MDLWELVATAHMAVHLNLDMVLATTGLSDKEQSQFIL